MAASNPFSQIESTEVVVEPVIKNKMKDPLRDHTAQVQSSQDPSVDSVRPGTRIESAFSKYGQVGVNDSTERILECSISPERVEFEARSSSMSISEDDDSAQGQQAASDISGYDVQPTLVSICPDAMSIDRLRDSKKSYGLSNSIGSLPSTGASPDVKLQVDTTPTEHALKCSDDDESTRPDKKLSLGALSSSVAVDINDCETVNQFLQALQAKGLLEKFGYKRTEPPGSSIIRGQTGPATHHANQNSCTTCLKCFARPCELKYVRYIAPATLDVFTDFV